MSSANGAPAVVTFDAEGGPRAVVVMEVVGGRVVAIRMLMNTDKLANVMTRDGAPPAK